MKQEDSFDKEHRREVRYRRKDGEIIYVCTFDGQCDWQYKREKIKLRGLMIWAYEFGKNDGSLKEFIEKRDEKINKVFKTK